MATGPARHKFYRPFTSFCDAELRKGGTMVVLALGMFLSVFMWGSRLLGWEDPQGQVQLGLFMSFLFGIICGYRTGH